MADWSFWITTGNDAGAPPGCLTNMTTTTVNGYSLENARRFGWATIGGPLDKEKTAILEKYVVGPRVLDAGCGGGGYVDYLARKGLDAVGVDKHSQFLTVAREKGFRGQFLQCDLADRLPFADAAFDTTVCYDVLEHVDDVAAISELARVTRSRLILTVPQEDVWMTHHRLVFSTYRDQTHLRYYTESSLRALIATANPAKVKLFGEQFVSIRRLAGTMLAPVSKYPFLSKRYRWLFHFLLYRCPEPSLYMNLAAVVDFDRCNGQVKGAR
jgi:SAM-dependent methyltransferase